MDWLCRSKWLGRNVLDWLIPPNCVSCGEEVASGGGFLCGRCFAGLRFVHSPFCDACALPITQEEMAERGMLCADCERSPPPWHRARAAFLYEGQARSLVMGLKYGSRTEHAAALAHFMARAGGDLIGPDVVLVPVPVHRGRLWQRGYNQAALMAMALARREGLACYPDALQRRFRTASLAGLSRQGRRRQMAGAVTLRPRYWSLLRGRRVVLVDDILTTGATAEVCVKALLEHGCLSVDILVAARVTLA
ncbi:MULTISPECIES: ComF family protein [Acetobacteraceae]|uniref:ComF family protein n=2 Tax=Acetobacteraceae TaxID=433 RepID=A0ABX4ZMK6_9PROT|nr:ComF family protein [Parasaccharibacter apium]MBE1723425.1 ComF family protein [Bombella apis]MCL1562820.1 ComF family protein [Parasaccharibacter sp. TMW 2.1886]MCQ0041124.1 ComF family protein [Bombella sp.]MBR9730204.1 ComF family protein [Bombella apis]POS61577.1 ComF family protein [Parasaccharibacter apium]